MQSHTRTMFETFATTRHPDATRQDDKFIASPDIEATADMEATARARSALLSAVNVFCVREQRGMAAAPDFGETLASTDNTAGGVARTATGALEEPETYECTPTNFDAAVPYALLDGWASHSRTQEEFAARVGGLIDGRINLDRVMIGFNGKRRELNSDRAAFPRLDDVNAGWLQFIKHSPGGRVHSGAQVGAGRTYASLDALVRQALRDLMEPAFIDDPHLVAIVGADLLPGAELAAAADPAQAPDLRFHTRQVGGLRAATAAFFPADAVLITRLSNLSLYTHAEGRRVVIREEPGLNRVELMNQVRDAYVVENVAAAVLLEKIAVTA